MVDIFFIVMMMLGVFGLVAITRITDRPYTDNIERVCMFLLSTIMFTMVIIGVVGSMFAQTILIAY